MAEPATERVETTATPAAQPAAAKSRTAERVDPADDPLFSQAELLRAVGFAVISAIVGFLLSLIGGAGGHPAPPPLDRRQAENGAPGAVRSTDVSFSAPNANQSLSYRPYPGSRNFQPASESGGGGIPIVVSNGRKGPTHALAPRPVATPTPTTLPQHRATPAPTVLAMQPATVPTAAPRPPPPPPPPPGPTFPEARAARPVRPPAEGRARLSGAVGRIELSPGVAVSCVVVDPCGLAVTRWMPLGKATHVTVTLGGVVSADVLGGLGMYDLAVLQLPKGGTYSAAPLAPEAPDGTSLAYLAQNAAGVVCAEKAFAAAGQDGFFSYLGVTEREEMGEPLINQHGEVAGLVLGRPWSYPGNAMNLAVDASVVNFAIHQARAGKLDREASPDVVLSRFKTLLARRVEAAVGSRQQDSVVAGQALGIYRLGTPLATLERELGNVGPPQQLPDPGFALLRGGPGQKLEFFLCDDRLVAVSTRNPVFTTRRGVGVGAVMVNIDPRRELGRAAVGEWLNGESYVLGPGLEFWGGSDGNVSRLVLEAATDLEPLPRGSELGE
ncbi:MAG: hypothetical protein ACYCW6_13475 [Candidatus Xenobia bacterium]